MSVLIVLDHDARAFKKTVPEIVTYGVKLATMLGTKAEGALLGEVAENPRALGRFGLGRIHQIPGEWQPADGQAYTKALAALAEALSCDWIVFSHNPNGRLLAPRLAARLGGSLVSGAVELPDLQDQPQVRRSVFSGKAFAVVALNGERRVITVQPNSFSAEPSGNGEAELISFAFDQPAPRVRVVRTEKLEGAVPLSEATKVVSGGRGLKGPENWGMIEELASLLGAATACSRAVADAGWRPHHEHVGQTGLAIAPNLYLAIAISGAIQHLAGVNRSKVIAVINKDPEAPFFKAADYGIVGDAFEVVPKLIEAVRELGKGE